MTQEKVEQGLCRASGSHGEQPMALSERRAGGRTHRHSRARTHWAWWPGEGVLGRTGGDLSFRLEGGGEGGVAPAPPAGRAAVCLPRVTCL